MKIEHIAERLDQLAAHRTPGRPRPECHVPWGEHILLREAAAQLRQMHADLMSLRHTNDQPTTHLLWALIDGDAACVVGYCNGDKASAQALAQTYGNNHRTRTIFVRAIYLEED